MRPDAMDDRALLHADPWRLIHQPGTSHDGHTKWDRLSPSTKRVTALDDEGAVVGSWIVSITEEPA